MRRTRGSADDAWFDERDAECRKHQYYGDEYNQWNRVADWSEPRRADGAQQKIRPGQNQIGKRERTAEAKAIRDGTAENCEKPHQSSEKTGEIGGAFGGKAQRFVQITRQGSEGGVVGKALKKFANVGDPEGALKACANVLEALAKAHEASRPGSCSLLG